MGTTTHVGGDSAGFGSSLPELFGLYGTFCRRLGSGCDDVWLSLVDRNDLWGPGDGRHDDFMGYWFETGHLWRRTHFFMGVWGVYDHRGGSSLCAVLVGTQLPPFGEILCWSLSGRAGWPDSQSNTRGNWLDTRSRAHPIELSESYR